MTADPSPPPDSAPATEPDEVEGSRMTLGEHLDELRARLIRSAIAMAVVFVVAWGFKTDVGEFALAPYEKVRPWLNADLVEIERERLFEDGEPTAQELEAVFRGGVIDAAHLVDPVRSARSDDGSSTFMFYLKVCGYATVLIAGPYILWQLWGFIAAGLYRHERRAVYRYFPASIALFYAGIFFGYTWLVPYAYYFLQAMGLEQIRAETFITPYLKFLSTLGLGMGVIFQLPILMMVLTRVGILEPEDFGKYRGHFWVGAASLAAILTPPDFYTQLMMAVPMAVLYEGGLLLARLVARREAAREAAVAGTAPASVDPPQVDPP